MTELTQSQKNKILAAVDIVEKGDLAVVKKIIEFQGTLEETADRVNGIIEKAESIIEGKEGRPGIQGPIGPGYIITDDDKQEIASLIQVPVVEKITERIIKEKESYNIGNIALEASRMAQEEIKSIIPTIDQFDVNLGVRTRDSLESLEGDNRLDKSAIKGLESLEKMITEENLNRAISIVDQRTSFLINKVSDLQQQLSLTTIARTNTANIFTGVQTITNITLPDQGQIKLTVPTTDLKATGFTCGDFNCGYSSSAIGDLVYLDSSSTWQKADANTLALYNGILAIALEVKASGAALLVALPGSFIYSTTGFPTWTVGSPIYMSETAGAMTQTQPTTTDAAIRVIGWGVHADKMYFYPSANYITHT